MQRVLEYLICEDYSGKTIRSYLKDLSFSKRCLSFLSNHSGTVFLNDIEAPLLTALAAGDHLRIVFFDDMADEIIKTEIPLDIVYEDEDIIIINKQSGLPVHPSRANYDKTLANGVAFHLDDSHLVFRCLNRLDRDTTGLTLIAKNLYASSVLSKEMLDGQIRKKYTAIVEGVLIEHIGTIDAGISRMKDSMMRYVDPANGESAITHFRDLGYYPKNNVSLVELDLVTGRTHQIRVHMKYIGHPLVGDRLYNPSSALMTRQALHSFYLEFIHPVTRQLMSFTVPLPEDMQGILL